MKIDTNHAIKFLARIQIFNGTECWYYNGPKDKDGYGAFCLYRKKVRANRISWLIHRGRIPKGKLVCHTCDNPSCVNPNHLFLGTNKDNISDRDRKGRQASGLRHGSKTHPEKVARGERVNTAKLTPKQVLKIRILHKSGQSMLKLARIFNVNFTSIYRVVKRESWGHI